MNNRIIVIDDEQDFLESVKRGLITSGFKNVRTETDPLKAATLKHEWRILDISCDHADREIFFFANRGRQPN